VFAGFLGIITQARYIYAASTQNIWSSWGTTIKQDICAVRDCSSKYYDDVCGICPKTTQGTVGITGTSVPTTGSIVGSTYSQELNSAYLYAYSVGITSMPTIQKANLDGKLLRSHMAKMMVEYAMNVLEKKADTKAVCTYTDIADQSEEMQTYMKLACAYGLMGIHTNNKFNPTSEVTRAEFATVLSRLLYGARYDATAGANYYENHLAALKTKKIITNTTPTLKELRANVMLMLWRATTRK